MERFFNQFSFLFNLLLSRDTMNSLSGLKDLADFLPASLATIVSYFSSEVTRGLWKPASMNGTDWPSPAANLALVEQQIKKILAATGVNVPSLAVGMDSFTDLAIPHSFWTRKFVKFVFYTILESLSNCLVRLHLLWTLTYQNLVYLLARNIRHVIYRDIPN